MLVAFFGLVVVVKLRGKQIVILCGVFTMGLGGSLCLVNVMGLFIPLRSPDLLTLPGNYGPKDVTLTPAEAFDLLKWRPADNKTTYSTRATMAVANSVLHGWPTVHMEKYRVAIPPTETGCCTLLGAMQPELRPYIF